MPPVDRIDPLPNPDSYSNQDGRPEGPDRRAANIVSDVQKIFGGCEEFHAPTQRTGHRGVDLAIPIQAKLVLVVIEFAPHKPGLQRGNEPAGIHVARLKSEDVPGNVWN